MLARGFTLVELLVVIAIIAILIVDLLAAVVAQREMTRRTEASTEIFALAESEATYLAANGDYATLDELIAGGLAPSDLDDAKKHGYEFVIETDAPPLPKFRIRASPCIPPLSVWFFVDESEVVRWELDAQADASSTPFVDVASIPTSSAEIELAKQVERDAGVFVRELDALPGAGAAISATIELLATEDVASPFYLRLDEDGDGLISLQDFLAGDTLALARSIKTDLGLPDAGISLGGDALLEAMIADYKTLLAATLQPSEELIAPAIAYGPGLSGDPESFLQRALSQSLPALGSIATVLLVAVLAATAFAVRPASWRSARSR